MDAEVRSPTSLADTLAHKPPHLHVEDVDDFGGPPVATTLQQMLPQIITPIAAGNAKPDHRGAEGGGERLKVTVIATPDYASARDNNHDLPAMHHKTNESSLRRGVSFRDELHASGTGPVRTKKPSYAAPSITEVDKKNDAEPKRLLPTAAYGAEKVVLPTAKVLTRAMDKASSRAPPQKANIQESVHLILAKLPLQNKGSKGSSSMQKQREANSTFLNKEMAHVTEARRSQKEMQEFQTVLEKLEESAAMRRRAYRRALDIAPPTGAEESNAAAAILESSDDDDDEEEDIIPSLKEERERLRCISTSSSMVKRINEKEARRWLETQKKVIENPTALRVLQDELQESADRLRAARTSRRNDIKYLLENPFGADSHASTTGPPEQDISWVSLPSGSVRHPPGVEDASKLQMPTNSMSTIHTGREEGATPPIHQVTEAQLLQLLQRGNGRSIYGVEMRSMTQKERAERENERRQQRLAKQQQQQQAKDEQRTSFDADGLDKPKRGVHFAPGLTTPGSESTAPDKGNNVTASSRASATPDFTQKKPKAKGFRVSKKHTEPLPAAPGVGDRSAALIRHDILSMRRRSITVEIQRGEDVQRTCQCVEQLYPLRVALLDEDLFGSYGVTHPSEWDAKYRTRLPPSKHTRGGRDTLQPLHHEPRRSVSREKDEDKSLQTGDVSTTSENVAEIARNVGTSEGRGEDAKTAQADEEEKEDKDQEEEVAEKEEKEEEEKEKEEKPAGMKNVHVMAPNLHEDSTTDSSPTTSDASKDKKTDLKNRKAFIDPGMMLEKHRRIIFDTALRMDDEDRKGACLEFIDCLELLSKERISAATWPSASAAFNHCRELINEDSCNQNFGMFNKLVSQHFLVEQLVQWPVQEMLRHLAGIFYVSPNQYRDWMAGLYQKMSNTHDYEGRFRAVDRTIKNKEIPTEAHVRITLHRCRKLPRIDVLALATPKKKTETKETNTADTAQAAEASEAAAGVEGKLTTDPASPSPQGNTEEERTEAQAGGESTVQQDSPVPAGFNRASAGGGEEDEVEHESEKVVHIPEYAVRLSAERQVITSSAVPAGNSPNGHNGQGEQGAVEGGNSEDTSNTVTARQRVYFYDQTFRLHLYDVTSVISVDLLSDSVLVSSGSFSIERYLHWKKSSIWLPLRGKYSRRTELQITIEVL